MKYLHMSYATAEEKAPGWLRPCLGWKVTKFVWRHHYLHHKYINVNFNLFAAWRLSGDFVRGVYREPSEHDIQQMQTLGIPTD